MTAPNSIDESAGNGYGLKTETATSRLRELVASGSFRPGEHLRQDHVAHLMGLTRVPVREAFKTLTADRILVHRRNLGHFVAELTSGEMADICWVREVLEAELARTAQTADPEVIHALRNINKEIADLIYTDAVHQRIELDEKFHSLLWELSPHRLLIEETTRSSARLRPYRILMSSRIPDRDAHANQEHEQIIEALASGGGFAYQQALVAHLRNARVMVELLREQETSLSTS